MKAVSRVLVIPGATVAMAVAVVWFTRAAGFWSWVSAFGATWFVLAWVAALSLLTRFPLPEWYYRPKGFEKSGRVYEALGVLFFRKLVRRGPIHILAPAFQYSGRREFLPALERQTRTAEAVHVLAFLASLMLFTYALSNGSLDSAGWVLSLIGIGAAVTRRPLPHHRAYGSVHGGSSWLRQRSSNNDGSPSDLK